jgi:hypothetical protein
MAECATLFRPTLLSLQDLRKRSDAVFAAIFGCQPCQRVVAQRLPQRRVAIQRDDVARELRRVGTVAGQELRAILPAGLLAQQLRGDHRQTKRRGLVDLVILDAEKNDSSRHGRRRPAMTDGAVDGSIFSTAGIRPATLNVRCLRLTICKFHPSRNICRASWLLSWPASAMTVRIVGLSGASPANSRLPARRSDMLAGSALSQSLVYSGSRNQ